MSKYLIIIILACSFYTSQAQCNFSNFPQDPTLVETYHGKVKGKCSNARLSDPDQGSRTVSVLSWQGIPFAQPPVGKRRFMGPAWPLNWTSTLTTTSFSKTCIQGGDAKTMSEDCLYLNIYAPLKKSSKPLPVFVYIHAGGLTGGSAASLNGVNIVAQANIIVVTFNYRLGPLGFMYLPEVGIKGNAGFLDQFQALKWIYKNIAKFGGDHKKITIGGHSAGGWSVGYHLVHQPSWRTFTNAIMISGSVAASKLALLSPSDALKRSSGAFEVLGCPSSLSKTARLQCIQDPVKLNPNKLYVDAQNYVSRNVIKGSSNLSPKFHLVQNGIDFNESIKTSFANGRFKSNANIVAGHTKDEGGYYFNKFFKPNETVELNYARFKAYVDKFYYFLPTFPAVANVSFRQKIMSRYTVPNQKNYLPSLIQMLGETVYTCPTVDLARYISDFNSKIKVFRYSFDHFASLATTNPKFGVSHGMTSGIWNGGPLTSTKWPAEEKRLSRQVVNYWTNFVKYGDPNVYDAGFNSKLKGVNWPQFFTKKWSVQPELANLKYESYLSIKVNITVKNDASSFMKCDLWKPYNNLP